MFRDIYIVAAKRTPFGAFGGSFKNFSATELATVASLGALKSSSNKNNNILPSQIDSVFVGNVLQSSVDAAYISRHVQLKCDIPREKPALTINRLCGSGFQSIVNGLQDIQLGQSEVSLCAGTDNMSQAPLAVYGQDARFGVNLGLGMNLKDTLWSGLTDELIKTPMGITAENLAEKYSITRQDCDEYAVRSQQAYKVAHDAGVFKAEIEPVELSAKKKTIIVENDEHPREVAIEKLAKLPSVFKKDGTVTAANASGICDGAGAVIVASEEAVKKHGYTPLARIVSYAIVGVDPTIMGIGPVPAMNLALERANLTMADMDRIEINEAFAAQYLACEKELGIDRSKANINGGAISLGHPLAASGSRITAHLTHDLIRLNKRYAIGAACIGGGQGIAIILENATL